MIALLASLPRMAGTDLIFPSTRSGPMSDMTLSAVTKRMHAGEVEAGRKVWVDPTLNRALGNLISRAAAGVPKSARGLRKTRAASLAEAGATGHQIGARTGHESRSAIQHHVRSADRRRAVLDTDPERTSANSACPAWHAEKHQYLSAACPFHGDPGRTRTLNLAIRSRLLYPVELRGPATPFCASLPAGASGLWRWRAARSGPQTGTGKAPGDGPGDGQAARFCGRRVGRSCRPRGGRVASGRRRCQTSRSPAAAMRGRGCAAGRPRSRREAEGR